MNATVSFTTSLAHSWAHAAHHMAPRPAHRRRVQILCAALAVLSFAVDVQAASEAEVKVTGCVVDHGGQPYRGVEIALSGVNYKGGAGYTGNNSETRTDARGEFTVRMKAGAPERPAQAKIRGKIEIYTTQGWTGSVRSADSAWGADVWPETLVQNIGKPVDLRPKGCIRFPYPITVLGTVTSDNLYEQDIWPHRSSLTLRLSRGDGYLDMGTQIPGTSGRTQEINFGVDFRSGDTYSVDIIQQPYSLGPAVPPTQKMCIQCDLVNGKTETIGLTPGGRNLMLAPGTNNTWATHSLRLQCRRKSIVKPDVPCEVGAAKEEAESAEASDDEAPVALSREGAKSGAKQFQRALEQAEQEERERLASTNAAAAAPAKTTVTASVPSSSTGPALSDKSLPQTDSSMKGSLEIILTDRLNQKRTTLKVPVAAYYLTIAKFEQCSGQVSTKEYDILGFITYKPNKGKCPPDVYQYNTQGIKPEYKLRNSTRNFTNAPIMVPECSYMPNTFYETATEDQPAEVTCQLLMMAEIHEKMEFQIRYLNDGSSFFSLHAGANVIPGTSTGDCEQDSRKVNDEFRKVWGRRPLKRSEDSSSQVLLYFALNRLRVVEQSCKDNPKYSEATELRLNLGNHYRSCTMFKTDTSVCVPKIAW